MKEQEVRGAQEQGAPVMSPPPQPRPPVMGRAAFLGTGKGHKGPPC